MKKKLLSVLLALCMVSGTVVSPVNVENVRAEENDTTQKTSDGFEYEIWNVYDEDEEEIIGKAVGITNYSGIDTSVMIPEKIEGLEVVALEVGDENSTIQTLHIPYTVTSISGLSKWNTLTTITVDENNTEFSSVDGMLYNKEKTEIVSCPVTKEGEVNVLETVTNIRDYAFSECTQLTKVNLFESVKRIGESAFAGCTNLTSFYIPKNVTEIGYNAFSRSFGMLEITVDAGNAVYTSEDGILYNKEKTLLIDVPQGKVGVVTVPEGVTTIGYSSFGGCKKIAKVIIPESVITLDEFAFYGCAMKNIQLPNGLKTISSHAFRECEELVAVTLPNSVETMGSYAFAYCDKLKSINFSTNMMKISSAFDACVSLEKIWVPSNITAVADYAFWQCSNLKEIYYEGSEEDWNKIEINSEYNADILNATVHYNFTYEDFVGTDTVPDDSDTENYSYTVLEDGTVEITDYTETEGVTEIVIPAEIDEKVVSSIGYGAFFDCRSLTEIVIPSSVTSIGTLSFNGCSGLTEIIIPSSVTSIGDDAFYGCRSLTEVVIPSSVTSIGREAFQNCEGLTKIEIPSSVTNIEYNVFRNCNSLTEISIPSSVVSIGDGAFYGCRSLAEVAIPNSVVDIGYEAFKLCGNLTEIYYDGTEKEWKEISIDGNNEALTNASIHYKSADGELGETDKIPENPQPETPPVTTPNTESSEKVEDTKEPEITTVALCNMTVSTEKTSYTGKSQTPSVTVIDANGQPVDAANYTVTYTNNKNVGQATVTVTGTNNYTGTLTATFTILPKGTSLSKITAKKKAFTVKWKKQTKQTTGYQLAYSTNKNFKGAKTITVKKNKTTSATVKKLKAKKKYYVRIRAYKTVKINDKSTKLYSDWSKPKTVKTKK